MMHAVMRRRIENSFKPFRQTVNRFGVDPILVEQIERADKAKQERMHAQKDKRRG